MSLLNLSLVYVEAATSESGTPRAAEEEEPAAAAEEAEEEAHERRKIAELRSSILEQRDLIEAAVRDLQRMPWCWARGSTSAQSSIANRSWGSTRLIWCWGCLPA